MKAEIQIDSKELVKGIAAAVLKELKPMLPVNRSEDNNCLLTVETLAKYLNVSKQWVYERITLNEIPFYKIGKFPRFKKSDIDSWLESQKVPAMNHLTKKLKVIK